MNAQLVVKRNQIGIILFLGIFLFTSTLSIAQSSPDEIRIRKVVIDPGHGGKDPGAVGSFSYEKDLTLKLSLKLGGYIKENFPDIEIIYTRDTDKFVELYKRAQMANKQNADLFISIHINAAGSPNAYGAETWVMGLSKSAANLAVAKKENSVIENEENYESNYDGFDPNSPESNIMFSIFQNANLDQSLNLAGLMQDQFTNRVGRHNRGVKQAGFLVLYKTAMPSILIEAGFISNPTEEKYLNSEEGQTYMSSAMYRAFRDYKKIYESDNMIDYGNNTDILGNDNSTDNLTTNETEDTATTEQNSNLSDSGLSTDSIPSFPAEENIKNEVVFRVQIGTSSKATSNIAEKYPTCTNVWEYQHNHLYKHTTGKTSDYSKILELYKNLKSQYDGCFIVAFENNKRISVREALDILNKK
jgi:N-acetylmuramoyl-L-alanine amidase